MGSCRRELPEVHPVIRETSLAAETVAFSQTFLACLQRRGGSRRGRRGQSVLQRPGSSSRTKLTAMHLKQPHYADQKANRTGEAGRERGEDRYLSAPGGEAATFGGGGGACGLELGCDKTTREQMNTHTESHMKTTT